MVFCPVWIMLVLSNLEALCSKMATMFRKPKRNFRQRVVTNDSDEENNDNEMEVEDTPLTIQPATATEKKVKEKKKKDKSKSVLSFDHEEGDI